MAVAAAIGVGNYDEGFPPSRPKHPTPKHPTPKRSANVGAGEKRKLNQQVRNDPVDPMCIYRAVM